MLGAGNFFLQGVIIGMVPAEKNCSSPSSVFRGFSDGGATVVKWEHTCPWAKPVSLTRLNQSNATEYRQPGVKCLRFVSTGINYLKTKKP